jgi:hypothetical protein
VSSTSIANALRILYGGSIRLARPNGDYSAGISVDANHGLLLENQSGQGVIDFIINCGGNLNKAMRVTRNSSSTTAYVGINTTSPSAALHVGGSILASGEITAGSDMRYKTPIAPITTIAPDKISKAPLFTFTWKNRDDTAIHLGSSAQYWQEIFPELVTGEDFLTLNYGALGTALGILNSRRIDTAEQRIAKLERENKKLKKEIKILKAERL